jgi:hypothetical protein
MILTNILNLAKMICSEVLSEGGIAVDATAGNGYDALYLCNAVGADGHVYAFDVQEQALAGTAERLKNEAEFENYTLVHDGHQNMSSHIRPEHKGHISVVMFNLGFLPGSDKSIVTRAETTIPAIKTSLELLACGGITAVAVYTGQDGGKEEEKEIRSFCAGLDYHKFKVLEAEIINKPGFPIKLFCMEKV